MTKLLTKPQAGQDELARQGKRAANNTADAPTPSVVRATSSARAARSGAQHEARQAAKNEKGGNTARPAASGAYASYAASAVSHGARPHVAPSSSLPLPTLPTAPTRLEASLTTVGDLARRYPSVAAFVAAGLPTPIESTPTPKPTKQAKPPKSAQAATGVRQRFAELRAALAEGWEIVQPIFARPLWSVADDSATAFNFVLSRAQATRLVTVPEGRTVSRFIHDQALVVDYRR